MQRFVLALLAVLALPTLAPAAERLSGEAIERAFRGNTVSGRYTNGGFFTEYHDPDGRALGHNGWQSNADACQQRQLDVERNDAVTRVVECGDMHRQHVQRQKTGQLDHRSLASEPKARRSQHDQSNAPDAVVVAAEIAFAEEENRTCFV